MQSTNSFHILASFAVFFSLLPGCTQQSGPPLAKVSGTVTLDGQPVENAGLEFIAEVGGVAYGKTDASGRYQMSFGASRTGAIVGKNRVRITAGDKITIGDKKYESTEVFPKKYNADSEQFVEVVRGSNRLDFTCQSGNFQPRQSISRGGN
jgi:hypothetical protein